MTQLGNLATFGYSVCDTQVELENALVANRRAFIVDIRLHPVCAFSPLWTREALSARYGKRYFWRGNVLGNVNHQHREMPMQLADEDCGISFLLRGLTSGYTLLLLCGCSSYERCHRSLVYEKVNAILALPAYSLGERVLTPCGAGTIDPRIPLDVHRARNRYGVLLDIPRRLHYFFPYELASLDVTQRALREEEMSCHG